jgi:putative Mn2+ efflux pump MntP
MNKLFDLRFVIGAFFTIIGIMLIIYGFLLETEGARDVNRWCGIIFLVFGVLMIILSFQKDANDELINDPNKKR